MKSVLKDNDNSSCTKKYIGTFKSYIVHCKVNNAKIVMILIGEKHNKHGGLYLTGVRAHVSTLAVHKIDSVICVPWNVLNWFRCDDQPFSTVALKCKTQLQIKKHKSKSERTTKQKTQQQNRKHNNINQKR